MNRILMIVYNTIQNDARVIRAAEALSKAGYKIEVLSCNSDKQFKNQYFTSKSYHSTLKGPLLLIAFWGYVLRYMVLNRDQFDILYVHDYFMPVIGRIHSVFSNKKWIYDAHELLIQRKSHKLSHREKLFLFLEKISIKNASLVIAANEERLRIINAVYKLKNSISVSNISDIGQIKSNGLKENTIVYQGVLNEERNVSVFIRVLKLLPKEINLKLIGGGKIEFYKKLADQLGLSDRVIFTGRIPYKNIKSESMVCKLGFVNYRMDDLNNLYCSPNKLYEYAQFGVPMIVTPQPFLVRVVRKYGIGEVWDNQTGDLEDLADVIQRIINNNDIYRKNMSDFNSDYSNDKEMSKLVNAVQEI